MKVLLVLLLSPLAILGQKTAFWETKLFFEDGLGNKDSITIGHDLESNGNFNPEFGEVNIKDVPWNSDFEVRASHNEGANNHASPKVLSKKIIGDTEAGLHPTYKCLFVREPLKFFVKIKNFPLRISWNSSDHSDFCNLKNYMTPHITPQADPYWFADTTQNFENDYVCFYEKNEYVLHDFSKYKFYNFILEENSIGSFDTIHGFFIAFLTQSSSNSPCSGTVDVKDLIKTELEINVYPNPTVHSINVESLETLTWQLYDNQGRFVKNGVEHIIDIQNMNNGMYLLKIKIKDRIIVKKIIKSS